ncbi:MAG: sensor histidine kinase [bacterium]
MFNIDEYYKTREKVFNVFSEILGTDRCALVIVGERSERIQRGIIYVIGNEFSDDENSEIRDRFCRELKRSNEVDIIDNKPLSGSERPLQLKKVGKFRDMSLYIIYETSRIKKFESKDTRKLKKEGGVLCECFMKGFEDAHIKMMTSIVKNTGSGFIVFNNDGEVILFNDRMIKILGLKEENLIGRNIYDVMGSVYKRWEREQVEESVKNNKTEVLEIYDRVRHNGLSEYHKIGLSQIETIWGKIYILIDNDLTYWVEVEKLSKYKSDFISSITHNLKTPLTTIIGYMDILKTGLGSSITPQHKRCIEQSIREARRLAGMIDQTLELSLIDLSLSGEKDKLLEKRWFSIQILMSVLVEDFYQRAEDKGLELSVEIEKGLNTIYSDEKKLSMILRNLLDNAVKFTMPGGRVGIKIYKKRGNILFEVIDTGIGIPDEEKDRIFERFYKVQRGDSDSYGGVGLGMYIVKAFVKLLGGSIEVESILGEGSTFRVSFPQP